MFFEGITKTTRPFYFHDEGYEPNLSGDNSFSGANVISDQVPDLKSWIYDRLQIHALNEVHDPSKINSVMASIETARNYDRTTAYSDQYHTVVTQMYVCELLVQALVEFFGSLHAFGHGYHWDNRNGVFVAKLGGRGLAISLHNLFFSNSLCAPNPNGLMPDINEYLRFLPELRKDYPAIDSVVPLVLECSESYGACGLHPADSTFHQVSIDSGVLHDHQSALKNAVLFPEQGDLYTIGVANQFSSEPISSLVKADRMISTTHEIDGQAFALGFGGTNIPKMRDIEIRYYLMFVLGSLARYSPTEWITLQQKHPLLYFKVRRFLEHNQIMFPLLVLRYLSGRTYIFSSLR